jgi:hypothetical protein
MRAAHFFNEIIAEQQLRQLTTVAQGRLRKAENLSSRAAAKRLIRSPDNSLHYHR